METPDEIWPKDLIAEIVTQTLDFVRDFQSVGKGGPVEEYVSLVRKDHLPRVREDCIWDADVEVAAVGDRTKLLTL